MLTVFWKGYKMVHFVGAGSGAADLITIRGKKLLENADIIIRNDTITAAIKKRNRG